MGYKLPDRTITLHFSGDFDGLEVMCTRNVPLGVFMQLEAAIQDDKMDEALQLFGDRILVAWNMEGDNGEPVAVGGSALIALPVDLAAKIIMEWQKEIRAVPAPLEQPSMNGATQPRPEREMPMDLGSMSTPN